MAEPVMDEVINVEEALQPCNFCGRTFLPVPLSKHIKVCQRSTTHKRKVFDSLKQRIEGTDLAPFNQTSFMKRSHHTNIQHPNKSSNKWREKHLELVHTIRTARGVPTIDMGSPRPSASGERCPTCDRQFGPKAYERHVEWCKEHHIRLQQSPAEVRVAKERLEARTKYRVPPPKSKRALVREKYSPAAATKTESLHNIKASSSTNLERSPSIRKPKNITKKPIKDLGINVTTESQDHLEEHPSKLRTKDRIVPKDVKIPLSESNKSLHSPSQTKLRLKINSIAVNEDVEDLKVSQVKMDQGDILDSRRMVTWKDTVNSSSSTPKSHPKSNQLAKNDKSGTFKNNDASFVNVQDNIKVSNNKQLGKLEQSKLRHITNKKNMQVFSVNLTSPLDGPGFLTNKKDASQHQNKDNAECNINDLSNNKKISSRISKHNSKDKKKEKPKDNLSKIENVDQEDNNILVTKYREVDKREKVLEKNFCHIKNDHETIKNSLNNPISNNTIGSECLSEQLIINNNISTKNKHILRKSLKKVYHSSDEDINNKVEVKNELDLCRKQKQNVIDNKQIATAEMNSHIYETCLNKTINSESQAPHESIGNKQMHDTINDLNNENEDEIKMYDSTKWKGSEILCAVQKICNKERYETENELEAPFSSNKILNSDDKDLNMNVHRKLRHKTLHKSKASADDKLSNNCDFENNETRKTVSLHDEINKHKRNSEIAHEEITTTYSTNPINNYASQNSGLSTIGTIKTASLGEFNNHSSDYALRNCASDISSTQITTLNSDNITKISNNSSSENARNLKTLEEEITNNSSLDSEFHSLEIVKSNCSLDDANNPDSDFENVEPADSNEIINNDNQKVSEFEHIEMLEYINKDKVINRSNSKNQACNLKNKRVINEKHLCTIFSKEKLLQVNESDCESNVEFSTFSKVDILHKSSREATDIESLDGTNADKWNEALSGARLERTGRKCSSEVHMESKKSCTTVFITSTECDIKNKDSDYYCEEEEDVMYEDCSDVETSPIDKVLEIAGEQFVASHRSDDDSDIRDKSNRTDIHNSFDNEEENIPAKRRRIYVEDEQDHSPSISSCTSRCSSAKSNLSKDIHQRGFNDKLEEDEPEEKDVIEEQNEEDETANKKESSNSRGPVQDPMEDETDKKKARVRKSKDGKNNKSILLKEALPSTAMAVTPTIGYVSPRLHNIIEALSYEAQHEHNNKDKNMLLIAKKHCKKLLQMDSHSLVSKNKVKLPKIKLQKSSKLPSAVKKDEDDKNAKVTLPALQSTKKECKSKIPVTKCSGKHNNNKKNQPRSPIRESTLPEIVPSSDKQQDYNPFVTAERQLMELLECDDFKPFFSKSPSSSVQFTQRPHTTANAKSKYTDINKTNKIIRSAENTRKNNDTKLISNTSKRASVIDPPADFQDQLTALNDDFELIESLINQNYIDNYDTNIDLNDVNFDNISNKVAKGFFLHPDINENEQSDVFSKERKYSDDMSLIDPRLINENDNLSIPESLKNDDQSSNSSNDNIVPLINNIQKGKDSKSSVKSNSSSRMNRSVSLDVRDSVANKNIKRIYESKRIVKPIKQTTKNIHKSTASLTSSYGSTRNNLVLEKKKTLNSLKRSISLVDPVKPKNLKNKQDVESYFDEQEKKHVTKMERHGSNRQHRTNIKENTANGNSPIGDELFSVDDETYEEYKRFEEMYLREKQLQMQDEKKTEDMVSSGTLTPNEGSDNVPINTKVSADSAYSSLNRKAPKVRARATKLAPLNFQEVHTSPLGSPPSSGTENSPHLDNKSANQRMSKFCHECGNKYPINTAKFCVECGVKRLVL